MFISDFAIKRPIVTIVSMVALVVFGIAALINLQTDEFPDVQQPIVSVTIPYPGASPDGGRARSARPVEEAVFGISGVDRMQSTCFALDGFANITVFFVFEKTIQQASQDIRDEISVIRDHLPAEMKEPVLSRFDPSDQPIDAAHAHVAHDAPEVLTRIADPGHHRRIALDSGRGARERGGRREART